MWLHRTADGKGEDGEQRLQAHTAGSQGDTTTVPKGEKEKKKQKKNNHNKTRTQQLQDKDLILLISATRAQQ